MAAKQILRAKVKHLIKYQEVTKHDVNAGAQYFRYLTKNYSHKTHRLR